ncbi:MAG: Sir2 silent information regulator family NAD-dependent deacetylase [Candidatus Spyradocola sp.]|nr:Sir2 silent information regulator family NAD-dependent deacetylase [Candidatus Spyradocola sp.]
MCSRTWTLRSTGDYSQKIERLRAELQAADAILIGAGSGLSTSAGLTYGGERFLKYFSDFHEKYGIADIYSGGFYPFPTPEEYWAWWSRHIYCNRYDVTPGKPYLDLLELVRDKSYFVLTTNVDHQFQLAGFDKARLFYTQGDYGLWQCSKPCHQATYDNEAAVRRMVAEQANMRIPSELIPRCPRCGRPMTMNLRSDDTFVQDEGWYAAARRYEDFLHRHENGRILLLELGVGGNTPGIIKFPFLRMAAQNPRATYACLNLGEAITLRDLEPQSILLDADIGAVLRDLQ